MDTVRFTLMEEHSIYVPGSLGDIFVQVATLASGNPFLAGLGLLLGTAACASLLSRA